MSSSRAVTPLIILLVLFLQAKAADSAEPCDPDICTLPDCFCSGTKIPGNLSPFSTPQIVMISFDAALVDNAFPLYEELFNGRLNPKPQWLQHLCYIFRVTRVHELLHAANVVPPTPRNRWQLHLPSSSTNLVGNCNWGRTGAGDRRHERDFTQMGQRPSGRYHGLQGSLHPGWWKHGVQGASEPGFPVRVFDAYSGL